MYELCTVQLETLYFWKSAKFKAKKPAYTTDIGIVATL